MQQYQIKQSRLLRNFNLSLYLLVIFSILIFSSEILMAELLVLLALLLMISDYRRWQVRAQQAPVEIIVYPDSGMIEIQQPNDPRRFNQFSVYLNRWFLILRPKNRQRSSGLLLVTDRFRTATEYLDFRRQIVKMDKDQYAA